MEERPLASDCKVKLSLIGASKKRTQFNCRAFFGTIKLPRVQHHDGKLFNVLRVFGAQRCVDTTAEALIDSLIVSGGLKTITQRTRAMAGRERSEFFDGGYSFPSGHSVQAWSAAAVIASEYHDKPWIKVAAYGVAGAVSVARFTEHKHYISDVVVGSVAGYAIGKYVYRAHHRDTSDSVQQDSTQSRWPMIMPQFAPHHYGAQLTWTF